MVRAPMKRLVAMLLLVLMNACRPSAPLVDAGVRLEPPDAGHPPVARIEHTEQVLHGVTLSDDYGWMKRKGPAVEAWLREENAWTHAQLAPHETTRTRVLAELRARLVERDDSLPTRERGYVHWYRTEGAYGRYLRAPVDGGPEELELDPQASAPDASFVDLGGLDPSPDDRLLAYTVDTTGGRDFTLHVRQYADGGTLDAPIAGVASFAWADGHTLFYTRDDDAKRAWRLYRHQLGGTGDALVFEERDEHFDLSVSTSRSERFVFVATGSLTTNEVRLVDVKRPSAPPRVVLPRAPGQVYAVEHTGGSTLVLRINDTAPTYRVVEVPLEHPADVKRWRELVPAQPEVMIDDVEVFADWLVSFERAQGLQRLRVINRATLEARVVDLPGESTLGALSNPDPASRTLRFTRTSAILPPSAMELELATGGTRTLKTAPVPDWESAGYETARVEAVAADGTRVPISLAYRKGLAHPAPLLLRAYGAYGDSSDPGFSLADAVLLERGVIVAEAHVRGGGEFGKGWHDQGRLLNKPNTFSDFAACAQALQTQKWTTEQQLIINGGSAGGLLMGAVLNQHPELFHAAYVEVPFVDVINSMLDESLPLTVGEFEEWGNPREPRFFEVMRSYSPYDNVKRQAYPPMLVRSSYNDTQVLFHEPSKWVAKLRALKTDANPLLLLMQLDAGGHGGRASRYDQLEDDSWWLTFMLWQWGLE
jgi:oligopeptidase B